MKLNKHFIATLALGAIALSMTASRAAADQIYKGSFTLPVEAYWGSTLLQPGEYTITMDSDTARASLIYLRGEGLHITLLAGPVTPHASERSLLRLEDDNGAYVVRQLQAGSLGKIFGFGIPKVVRARENRAATGTPVSVPVAANGGF